MTETPSPVCALDFHNRHTWHKLPTARQRLITKLLLQTKPGNRTLATRYALSYELLSKLQNPIPLKTTRLVGVPDLDHLQAGSSLILDHKRF